MLVLIQVGVASLRLAKHTPRKTEKSKNENPKPSDARSHADPLDATLALTRGGYFETFCLANFRCIPLERYISGSEMENLIL